MRAFLLSVFIAAPLGCAVAQIPGPWDNDSTNQLSVSLWLPEPTNTFHAPATIKVFAYVQLREARPQPGDATLVVFYANGQRLGGGKAVWHGEIRPHAPPGAAIPMWVRAAGFDPAEWTWKKAPAGTYALMARATWTGGLAAVSPPLNITVLPN